MMGFTGLLVFVVGDYINFRKRVKQWMRLYSIPVEHEERGCDSMRNL
jgi:hypothetical protein